jgi:hypothetical protein
VYFQATGESHLKRCGAAASFLVSGLPLIGDAFASQLFTMPADPHARFACTHKKAPGKPGA